MDFVSLSKILPLLVFPFNAALWLTLAGLILLWFKRVRGAGICVAIAVLILGVAGNPSLAFVLYSKHERSYLPVPVEDSPRADAIVVLGGGLNLPLPPRLTADLNSSADRLLHTKRLYLAGKAPWIIIAGGNVFEQEETEPEAYYAAQLLQEWGVAESAILREGRSRNTHENAILTKELMNKHELQKVLLVTSAFHMPRALAVFTSAGIAAIPSPTDYRAIQRSEPVALKFIPEIGALNTVTGVLREHIGMLVYRYRGWIRD